MMIDDREELLYMIRNRMIYRMNYGKFDRLGRFCLVCISLDRMHSVVILYAWLPLGDGFFPVFIIELSIDIKLARLLIAERTD